MKFLDIFSGIGGFRSGMESAGHECVGFIEIDKHARKSYEAIYDTSGEFTAFDILSVDAEKIPKADVWCFGFPCQDISNAGKKKGLKDGKKSSLFYSVTGLIKETAEENRPKYLFIENVRNLLSIGKGFDFGRVLAELDAIGYDARWQVIDSKNYLPQHRERVYIVATLRKKRGSQVFSFGPIARTDNVYKPIGEPKILVRQATKKGYDAAYLGDSINVAYPNSSLRRGRVGKKRVNTLVTKNTYAVVTDDGIRMITPLECWRLQGFTDEQFNKVRPFTSDAQLYKQAGNSVTVPVISEIAKNFV